MSFDFSIITGKTIHRLLWENIAECVHRVEAAYLAHEDKQTLNPDSYFLRFPDMPKNRIIALPASLGGEADVAGIKWISSWPDNARKGFPRASAVLILNDLQTGYPFACLESSIISAARTAGSAALAAYWLNGRQRRTRTLGIVGTGLIARYIYTFLLQLGWEMESVHLYDIAPGEAERFATEVCRKERHKSIHVEPDHAQVLRASDIVLLATVAPAPYIHDAGLLAHNPIVLNISLRDVAPELVLQSHNIVDDVEHVMKAATSPHLAEKLSGGRAFVTGTLAGFIQGKCQVDRTRPILFSPFGLGVLDLAVGKWLYDRAMETGEAIHVPDFFFEMKR